MKTYYLLSPATFRWHPGEGGSSQNTYNHSLAEVHIQVTDKNDNAPIFSKKVFYYDFENTLAKELMNVTARDPDLGEGGKVTFRMRSSKRVSGNYSVIPS